MTTTHSGPMPRPPITTTRRSAAGDVMFGIAGLGDAAAVRTLLREQALGGAVRLSLEREPDARLAAGIEGDRHHTIVGRRTGDGRVVAVCSRSVRRVWVNGEAARIGYLGQLRRDESIRGRARLLRDGFAACEATRIADELPFDLTSIAADNRSARRLLEHAAKRISGVPVYRPLCGFMTMMIPVPHRRRGRNPRKSASDADEHVDAGAIADCLQRNGRRCQFAPIWTAHGLRCGERTRGLSLRDFHVRRAGDRIIACLARWDQRAFKQVVVRGYAHRLTAVRPLINAMAMLRGCPHLPAIGHEVPMAFLSHVVADGDDARVILELIDEARCAASGSPIDWLVIGFAEDHPMCEAVARRYSSVGLRTYRTMIYLVHHNAALGAVEQLDGRGVHLEVATL